MSYRLKNLRKMNGYLVNLYSYVDSVIHPAGGKGDAQKGKRRTGKNPIVRATPDSLNLRAAQRSHNAVRRNPAP